MSEQKRRKKRPGCITLKQAVRKTTVVDDELKDRNLKHLSRIEGQVRGVQKMVADDRYCADVLAQIAAVRQSLKAVARDVMRHHLRHCATRAISSGPPGAEKMYDELLDLMDQYAC